MSINKYPVRMCIVCMSRLPQSKLLRLQFKDGELCAFTKQGRSFYICSTCKNVDEKKLLKALNRKCKVGYRHILDYGKILKEIATNG